MDQKGLTWEEFSKETGLDKSSFYGQLNDFDLEPLFSLTNFLSLNDSEAEIFAGMFDRCYRSETPLALEIEGSGPKFIKAAIMFFAAV